MYNNDIPKELDVGKIYTSSEIRNFINFNADVAILSNVSSQFINSSDKFEVAIFMEAYICLGEHTSLNKKKIYIVKKYNKLH